MRVERIGTNALAHRGKRSEVLTDTGNLSQTRKRQHHARRPREGGVRHETCHKKHERRAEHGNLTGNYPYTIKHDYTQRTRGGIQQRTHASNKGHEVRCQ